MAEQYENAPRFGALAGLIGTWEGVKGWNVISVPALQDDAENRKGYKVIVQNYYETLTFEPVEDEVLNQGGEMDQKIGALKYKQEIFEFESNALLHVETGMLFNTCDVVSNDENLGPWQPPYKIVRSGTIPHGNSITILGNSETTQQGPVIPVISTYPNSPDIDLAAFEAEQERLTVYDIVIKEDSKIFNVENPNENLSRDNNGLEVAETTQINLDSRNAGDVVNIPFINKFANATRVQVDFWLQKVKLPMSDTAFDQLQYSQTVDIEFPQTINGQDAIVRFPHVTVNTMKRKV